MKSCVHNASNANELKIISSCSFDQWSFKQLCVVRMMTFIYDNIVQHVRTCIYIRCFALKEYWFIIIPHPINMAGGQIFEHITLVVHCFQSNNLYVQLQEGPIGVEMSC